MHLYEKRRPAGLRGLIVSVIALFLVAGVFAYAVSLADKQARSEQEARLREAIRWALITCYATEGQYPPSLDYLKTHYALTVDEECFIVSYDAFASNIMPDVKVYRKGEGA